MLCFAAGLGGSGGSVHAGENPFPRAAERQLTAAPQCHVISNIGAWSPDSRWIIYDVRRDGFDGDRIERIEVSTGKVETLFRARNGAFCGVPIHSPAEPKVAFIVGPENPTPDWQYSFTHREGVIVDERRPGVAVELDARDLTPPFTPGALRGGSHVHVFSPDGQWVSFTYQDALLERFAEQTADCDVALRNIAVSGPFGPVRVAKSHPRNRDGALFTVLVTRTTANPRPGSDEIKKAYEEGWVGSRGYRKADGSWQNRAIAFLGDVVTKDGAAITEVFVADIPDDITAAGDGPLAGTATRRPLPPKGTSQRRLTHTADRKHPGVGGTRHWVRSSPDGTRIAMLMKDDAGIAQFWTVSPTGGPPVQVTRNPWSIASAFTWSPDGRYIAHRMDQSVFVTDMQTGASHRLTPRVPDESNPDPLACVFSPDGKRIAYTRMLRRDDQHDLHIFVVELHP